MEQVHNNINHSGLSSPGHTRDKTNEAQSEHAKSTQTNAKQNSTNALIAPCNETRSLILRMMHCGKSTSLLKRVTQSGNTITCECSKLVENLWKLPLEVTCFILERLNADTYTWLKMKETNRAFNALSLIALGKTRIITHHMMTRITQWKGIQWGNLSIGSRPYRVLTLIKTALAPLGKWGDWRFLREVIQWSTRQEGCSIATGYNAKNVILHHYFKKVTLVLQEMFEEIKHHFPAWERERTQKNITRALRHFALTKKRGY